MSNAEPRRRSLLMPPIPLALAGHVDTVVNLGARNPRYAHTDDVRVERHARVRGHDVLTALLIGRTTTRGRA